MAKFNSSDNRGRNRDDKILSTPAVKGDYATSESSNLTIASGHVGASNKSIFIDFEKPENSHYTEKTMDLEPDDDL
jgi:hypothetical protein